LVAGECKAQSWADEAMEIPIEIDRSKSTSCVEHFVRVLRGEKEHLEAATRLIRGIRSADA